MQFKKKRFIQLTYGDKKKSCINSNKHGCVCTAVNGSQQEKANYINKIWENSLFIFREAFLMLIMESGCVFTPSSFFLSLTSPPPLLFSPLSRVWPRGTTLKQYFLLFLVKKELQIFSGVC